MMDIKSDVAVKLAEKGYVPDNETVEKVFENFQNALFNNGYWEILEQTIEESNGLLKQISLENVEIGKEYVIMPSYVKTALHNKKVKVEEVTKDLLFPITATVLEGRMKGNKIGLETSILKEI